MKNMNKNSMIHEIKEKIGKVQYVFPIGTMMLLDYYEDYLPTCLMYLKIHDGKLLLVSKTLEHGIEADKLSDFHSTIVKDIYDIVMN